MQPSLCFPQWLARRKGVQGVFTPHSSHSYRVHCSERPCVCSKRRPNGFGDKRSMFEIWVVSWGTDLCWLMDFLYRLNSVAKVVFNRHQKTWPLYLGYLLKQNFHSVLYLLISWNNDFLHFTISMLTVKTSFFTYFKNRTNSEAVICISVVHIAPSYTLNIQN